MKKKTYTKPYAQVLTIMADENILDANVSSPGVEEPLPELEE